ncbi:MAG TPA: hypothetical protein VKE69_13570 [Planctomycetota bacterium]|nr:hypothetical protein [Planctomycetota bacterium]
MHRDRLVAVAMSLAAAACDGRAPVLAARRVGDEIELEARARSGHAVAVLASRLWSAETPRDLAWADSVLDASASPVERIQPFTLGESRGIAPLAVTCTLRVDVVPEGTSAVQAASLESVRGRVVTRWSNAFVLERKGGAVELRAYASRVGETYGAWWILGLAALAVVALGTRAVRIPTDRRPRLWRAAMIAAALALLAPRIWRIPERSQVESGLVVPPLFWPPDWSIGGDGVESTLGPGFRALERAARERLRPDDTITIVVKENAIFDVIRATYLANRLPRASLIIDPTPCPPGLAIFVGRPAEGTVLAKFEAGTFADVGEARR